MNRTKAIIESKGTYISFIYGKNSTTIYERNFKGLIDSYTTKEHFVEMAENMCHDFLQMEGHDWEYDSRELQRKLAIIYDNLIQNFV